MDVSLKSRSEKEFLDLFADCADDIAVEKLCPLDTGRPPTAGIPLPNPTRGATAGISS